MESNRCAGEAVGGVFRAAAVIWWSSEEEASFVGAGGGGVVGRVLATAESARRRRHPRQLHDAGRRGPEPGRLRRDRGGRDGVDAGDASRLLAAPTAARVHSHRGRRMHMVPVE